jgi:O-antigen ligase
VEYSAIETGSAVRVGRARTERRWRLFDDAVFWGVLAGLGWVPLRYGSNVLLTWGVNAIVFPGLLCFYELTAALPGRRHPVALGSLGVSAALFTAVILWAFLQTATWLPPSWGNPIWPMAADALGRPVAASISVDRDLSALALLRLITAASVFWLTVQLTRDARRARRLVVGVAAICAAYAAYGLVASKTGLGRWLDIPVAADGRVTATFINPNSYATYAGMGLIAASGLLIELYRKNAIYGGSRGLRLAVAIELLGGSGAALIAALFIGLAALFLTGSRGGVMATAAGLAALGAVAWRRGGRRRRPAGPIAVLLAVALAAAICFGAVFTDSLGERGLADSNRLAVSLLTLRSTLDAPLFGFGYGTFADVFPLYRDRSIGIAGTWGQAHNSYVETLQGLGFALGAMLIATLVLLPLRCLRGALHRQEHALAPQVAVGVACLVGVQAVVDFSLQIQAVALTFAALLGAGVAQATSSRVETGD